jgi:imidazolonepropionase-like amidohydrolase
VRAWQQRGAGLLLALVACASNTVPAPAPVQPSAKPRTTGVRCGSLWDPGAGTVADARVIFDGERVVATGPASQVPPPTDEIDLRPLFCLPGLVDAHTHLTSYARESASDGMDKRRAQAAHNAELTLRAGFTTVRDLGGAEGVDLWLRARIGAHAIPGPRMQCAGSQIGTERSVGGTAGIKADVDAHADAGFDVIKLFATGGAQDPVPLLTAPEIAAATAEAHARGLRVAVHAVTSEGIARSITGGVDSVEHAHELTPERAAQMAAAGITLVPTLYILRYYIEDAEALGLRDEHVADLRRTLDGLVVPFEARFPAILATGVKVAMGSDSFMALHGRNARELSAMVQAGMTPEQALRAATTGSADVMGWKGRVGTLAPGAFADVVAMSSDPLADIHAVEHVSVVLAGGKVVRDDRPMR